MRTLTPMLPTASSTAAVREPRSATAVLRRQDLASSSISSVKKKISVANAEIVATEVRPDSRRSPNSRMRSPSSPRSWKSTPWLRAQSRKAPSRLSS